MLQDITLGQFFPGNSPIHRLDPRTKLVITILYIVLIFLVRTFWGYLVLFAFIAGSMALSKLHFKFLLRGLKPVLFIVAFTFVLNILLTQGETVLWQWKFIVISTEGIYKALYMAVRLILLVICTQVLTLTTSPLALTDGLEQLLSPLKKIKVPVHEMAMMMTIALRFIPTLLSETDRIMKAQMSRGADFESGNIIRRAKNMVPLLVPLFVSAFRRADELALAMEARCYHGGEGRTRMKVLKMSRVDAWAALAALLLTALIIADRVLLGGSV